MKCWNCELEIPDEQVMGPVLCRCGKWLRMCDWGHEALPKWAQQIARWKRPGDRGVGDTFHRIVSALGAEQMMRVAAWFGITCNCEHRRDEWNARWPYDQQGQAP